MTRKIYDEPDDVPPGRERLKRAVDKQAQRDGERREGWRWRFAGMAMQGMLSCGKTMQSMVEVNKFDWPRMAKNIAEVSAEFADALLDALEGRLG